MKGKYFLLALIVICSNEVAQAHILPFAHGDFPTMQECVKILTRSAINLCSSVYGEYASDFHNDMMLNPREVVTDRWDTRVKVLRTCCLKPCTITDLLAIC